MISELLARFKCSHEDLGDRLGVHQSTVTRIANGGGTTYENGKKIEALYRAEIGIDGSALKDAS